MASAYCERAADAARRRGEKRLALTEDRPSTWVPLVFHGTTFKALDGNVLESSVRSAKGKAYVSLTELSINDLHIVVRTEKIYRAYSKFVIERIVAFTACEQSG